MSDFTCDVAIIGAGSAGLAAERSARRNGAKTLLIDDGFHGTTCASVGCMPSKLLIAASKTAHTVRQAGVFGIKAASPTIDSAAVLGRLHTERDRFVESTLKSIKDFPAGTILDGRAKFTGPIALVLEDGRTVTAKAVIIATGSRPKIPKEFEKLEKLILTNETIFELETLPDSIAVIGAGP